MDTVEHNLPNLFAQLGLPSESGEIQRFLGRHRPLDAATKLHEASWWNPAQSAFLKEAIEDDAEWAEAVDELDALLRYDKVA